MAIEIKKLKVKLNKPIYSACQYQASAKHLRMNFGMITLNQSIKAEQKCYIDIDSFVIHNITEDFYEKIADDV